MLSPRLLSKHGLGAGYVKQSCAYPGRVDWLGPSPHWRQGSQHSTQDYEYIKIYDMVPLDDPGCPARGHPCTRDQHAIARTFLSQGDATVARAVCAGKHLKLMVLIALDASKTRAHHRSTVKRELHCPLSEAEVPVAPNQSSCQNRYLRQEICNGHGTAFAFHSALHGGHVHAAC